MADTKLAKIGITVKEPWAAGISYEPLDYVLWRTQDGGDGCGYIAKRANIGVQPDSDDSVWIKSAQAGQSIYDLAVKYHHFDGTEEEFEQQYQQVLQDARDAASDTLATNTEVQNAEALRVAAEQARVSAESARAEAETDRQDAEDARASDESDREAAESARESAEASRQSAETRRASAESARSTAEVEREMAEEARGEAETEREADFEALKTDMQTAIGQVDAATAAAVATNTSIQSAEASRVAAETARETAESGRVSAESARVTAENGRVSAESGRVSAESARVSAETARAAQASSDHTRAESDHGTAATDHTTAGADHTQAGADHTASEAATTAANTAAAAADAARESIQDDLARKANIDGSYETMSVGLAKNLEGRTDVTGSFLERTTGGDAEVANGLAQLQEVDGKSQVWNQQEIPANSSVTKNGVTFTSNGDGSITANGTASGSNADFGLNGVNYVLGHKYIRRGCPAGGVVNGVNHYAYTMTTSSLQGADRGEGVIFTANTSGLVGALIRIYSGITVSNVVFWPQCIDLTLLFGSGNEPATVEEFEAWLAENIGLRAYYPYNAGTVLNVNMTGIETLGFNLLDPATGKARIIGAYSDVYGNYYGITGTHGTLTFTSDLGETSTITPDSDGKFLLEEPGELAVADAGADCSVFLWWDGTKMEHEDYERTVTNLDVAHIYGKLNGTGESVKVWPTGIPGIGDIKDSLKVVDGAVVAERKMGEVDMGTLTWDRTHNTAETINFFVVLASNIPGFKVAQQSLINPKYARASNQYLGEFAAADKTICERPNYSDRVLVRDDAYSTAADFKTAMSGQLLYYELTTPQTYTDLVYQGSELFADGTPVTMPTNYPVNNWSVERIVPQNSSEAVVTTAPELTCRYSIDAVETLNTHEDEIENLYEGLDELDARKPEKYGEYPLMTVGSANTIAGDTYVPAEFVARKTGGSQNVASGLASVRKVNGKTVVWNQLWGIPDATKTVAQVSLTYDSTNKCYVLNGTASGNNNIYLTAANGFIYSSLPMTHKGLIRFKFISGTYVAATSSNAAILLNSGNQIRKEFDAIGEVSDIYSKQNTNTYPYITFYSGDSFLNVKFTIECIDLTQMFGAGNEPSTVEEFEALYPLPYYEYNEGTLVNNAATGIETVGFNQWDEEWELGRFNTTTGEDVTSTTQIRAKNLIPILPNTTYYVGQQGTTTDEFIWCMFFDANKNILTNVSRTEIGAVAENGNSFRFQSGHLMNTPANAYYLRFYRTTELGATYNNDICLNLSDASKNGTYEPYWKETLQLNLPTLTGKLDGEGESVVICPDGLRSAGTAFDEAIVEDGFITKIVKRIGSVDLGTISDWATASGYFLSNHIKNLVKKPSSNSVAPNGLSSKYLIYYAGGIINGAKDPGLSWGQMGSLVVRDSTYSDVATFKTAMSGVYLYYELATPETYVLDTPIPVGYRVDGGGTERRKPDDTASSVIAPFAAEITYAIDARGFITDAPVNFVSKESMTAFLEAMKTANIISAYTVSFDANTQKYTYTMTKVS